MEEVVSLRFTLTLMREAPVSPVVPIDRGRVERELASAIIKRNRIFLACERQDERVMALLAELGGLEWLEGAEPQNVRTSLQISCTVFQVSLMIRSEWFQVSVVNVKKIGKGKWRPWWWETGA
jgi:hypothetical protein